MGKEKEIQYENCQKLGRCFYLKDAPYKIYNSGKRIRMAHFLCECGKEFLGDISKVKLKEITSCGCKHATGQRIIKKPMYLIWRAMKNRCYLKTDLAYKYYGGRGIRVCNEWKNDFQAFYNHVTKLPHYGEEGYSIDRIDNNGNYEPGNIRLADRHTQAVNQRKTTRNKSGYVGVHGQGDKWISNIRVNGPLVYLGWYDSKEEAVNARNNYIIANSLWEYPVQFANIV